MRTDLLKPALKTILILAVATQLFRPLGAEEKAPKAIAFPFKPGDRVAWIGSSSTAIGQYCQCMEFMLRTQHPELKLVCRRFSNVYMDTFAKCLGTLPGWLKDFKPTVVFFQYGGNDSVLGEAGLVEFKANAEKCIAMAQEAGAKVFLITPQGVDVQKIGPNAAKDFKIEAFNMYAEKLVAFGHDAGWTVLNTHQPLVDLLGAARKDDPNFTYTADKTHMTLPGYVAWAYIQYEMLNPPPMESSAEFDAAGKVLASVHCKIRDAKMENGVLAFTRDDEILPILPPVALPPRAHVPLEKFTRYLLKVRGLPSGHYEVCCEGGVLGEATDKALEAGVNLNTLLLDSKRPAPWDVFAKQIWDASKKLLPKGPTGDDPVFEQIGKTAWKFEVRKKP